MNIVPKHGERGLIIGKTGSGKTLFARFLLGKMPGTIIYDTKIEPKFKKLTKYTAPSAEKAIAAFRDDNEGKLDYAIVQPPAAMAHEPRLLDNMLIDHYDGASNTTAYIDEVVQFHQQGKAGPGLLNLLQRGRSRGITTLMSTQRPAWLSRSCLTESDHFYVFRLTDKRDWNTVSEVVPGFDELGPPPKYHFYYYNHDMEAPQLFAPVKADKSESYVDERQSTRRWF